MELTNLGGGAGYAKPGLMGFAGSGKTFTAVLIACGIRDQLGLKGPIAMLDTEAAAQYVAPRVKEATGLDLMGVQTRVLKDAIDFLKECQKQGVAVAIVDSVTHLWREVCDSYLKQINEVLRAKGKNERTRMEFQDWAPIKAKWEEFSNLYLNIPMHTIIAGRAGYEYDYQEVNEGSDRKELVKTGVRMKTEGEFGYEPSLLIHMERIQTDATGKLQNKITHRATVIKDRFGVLDGKECDNPTYKFFKPFVDRLTPGAHVEVPIGGQTDLNVNDSGDAAWQAERRLRTIYCEEIQGHLLMAFPGQSAAEKQTKAAIINELFKTFSWEKVQVMDSGALKAGLDRLPDVIAKHGGNGGTAAIIPPPAPINPGAQAVLDHIGGKKESEKDTEKLAKTTKKGGK